jgi:hypothetical protein
VYDLLGVRYVLGPPHQRIDLPMAHGDPRVSVWERATALPRLFLPRESEERRGAPWPAWIAANPDFARRALVEEGPGERPRRRWRARRPRAAQLTQRALAPEWIQAESTAPERRLLASSVLSLAGWRLVRDGRLAPTVLTNGIFLGAWLPPGEHRVELLYRPAPWLAGALLAAFGAAAALATFLAPPAGSGRASAMRAASRSPSLPVPPAG